MNEYLLTDGKMLILSKEQLELICYPVDVETALGLLMGD
jgi:hypothetical protein